VAHPPADAFDNNLNTFWCTLAPNPTGWLQYTFAAPVNIKRYRIYPHTFDYTECPRDWTFQVFTGGAWVTLQTVTGHQPSTAVWAQFYCPNIYTETQYRINISANNGDANYVTIEEMEMEAADVGQSVIIYPQAEFEDTPDYDLVLHISMGNSIGMGVQYPGYYEILAKQAPGLWFETFQTQIEATYGTILMERSWYARLFRQTQEGYRSAAQAARTVTIGG
jgi:hypothetical protein